jgi:hypothetical protein
MREDIMNGGQRRLMTVESQATSSIISCEKLGLGWGFYFYFYSTFLLTFLSTELYLLNLLNVVVRVTGPLLDKDSLSVHRCVSNS